MRLQIQFGLQYADFYLGHGILYASPPFSAPLPVFMLKFCVLTQLTHSTLEVAAFSATIEVFTSYVSCEIF